MSMDADRPRWAALFAGQLSERVGMGQSLIAEEPAARLVFERVERAAGRELLRPMLEGPLEEVSRDEVAQPAIFALGCATWEAIVRRGAPLPEAIAGYSLGNYAALVASGCLSFDDALHVLLRVLDLVHGLDLRGGMAAVVGLSEPAVRDLCAEVVRQGHLVEPANLNAENQVVVSGTEQGIDLFVRLAAPRCLRALRLPMRLPIHSSLMSPVTDALRRELPGSIRLSAPRIPHHSAVFGRRIHTEQEVLEILVHQVARPSLWASTVRSLVADGHHRFGEIGSGAVLTRMLRWIDRAATGTPIETVSDLAELVPLSAGAPA